MYSYLDFLVILVTISAVNGQLVGDIYPTSSCQGGTNFDSVHGATNKCFLTVCPASLATQTTPCSAQYICNGNEAIETQYSDPVCKNSVQSTIYTIGQCSPYADYPDNSHYLMPTSCTPNGGPSIQTVVYFADVNCTATLSSSSVARLNLGEQCHNQYKYSCPNNTGANVQDFQTSDSCVGSAPIVSYPVGQCLPGNVKIDCGSGIGYTSGGTSTPDPNSHTSNAWQLNTSLHGLTLALVFVMLSVTVHPFISY